jgi:histidinol-phosphate/aromatic aminotransferase/cobyric acid decarboxylase-like protein
MPSPALAIAHGGLVRSELDLLGVAPDAVLDFSVNVNPYGPCAAVRDAIAGADLREYPDPTATIARRALATWLDVAESRLVLGNGAVDLLWTLARAWLRPGAIVLSVEPTFSEMRTAATRVGARTEEFRLNPMNDFELDVRALDTAVTRSRPRLVYACSPSNPVGRHTSPQVFADLAARHPDTLFVVDLSFLSLSAQHAEAPWRSSDRVVWLRSLTKDHALAGLRIGCAVAPPAVARGIEEEKPPWSVNALAQAAAIAIASEASDRFVAESRLRLFEDRTRLAAALGRLGLRVHASDTVFALTDLGTRRATDLRATLLRDHALLIRDCTSFGLPHHIRIAARPRDDLDRLTSALTQALA